VRRDTEMGRGWVGDGAGSGGEGSELPETTETATIPHDTRRLCSISRRTSTAGHNSWLGGVEMPDSSRKFFLLTEKRSSSN
jgi:hypothetical protein